MKAYLGIPYAAAPVGPHRMGAPQPAPRWRPGTTAGIFGPTAPKGSYPPSVGALLPEIDIPGADYLNLNVWTPDPNSSGLPVLVWVHGGSFLQGSGSLPEYDGSAFARGGVVCVTLNYRLGVEGFLHVEGGPVNRGLLDVVAALEWVRDNITAFGGDPARVTVAGESAGAMVVSTLLATPAAEGLFASAIMQSGGANAVLDPDEAQEVAARVARELGIPPTWDALRAVPAEQCIAAAEALVWAPGRVKLPLAPVVDLGTVPQRPLAALRQGAADVRILVGTTRDEGRLFTVPSGVLDTADEAALQAAAQSYGVSPDLVAGYRKRRPAAPPGSILTEMMTDYRFRVHALDLADAHTGRRWVYRWDGLDPADNGGLGSCHAAEVPFVFGTERLPSLRPRLGDFPNPALGRLTHGTWVRFIAGDDPGWPQWTTDRRTSAVLTDVVTPVDDLDAHLSGSAVRDARRGGPELVP